MLSPQKAIKEKCFDCGYDEHDTGSRHEQIENCQSTDCALYEHRPVTSKLKKKRKQEAYANMTQEEKEKYDRKVEKARERFISVRKAQGF